MNTFQYESKMSVSETLNKIKEWIFTPELKELRLHTS